MTLEEQINRANYNDESVKSLKWNEHIRLRPGMYIGKLGDGASPDDGIYILIKETIDNSIDEYLGKPLMLRLILKPKEFLLETMEGGYH